MQNRKYLQAKELFQFVYDGDRKNGDLWHAGRTLTGIGACNYSLFRYQESLHDWLEARQMSESVADWVNLGSLGVNISAMFLVMGDLEAAAEAAERAMTDANRGGFGDGVARAQIQLGIVRARQGRLGESAVAMNRAVEMAEREGKLSTAAEAWDHFGEELLAHGALADADRALTEAYRLRKVHRLAKLDSSYYNLGRLRLAQGDALSALHLVNATLERGHHPDTRISLWALHYLRGQALAELGRTQEAFDEFRAALEVARRWRLEVLPADFTRVSSEVQLNQLYAAFIEAGNRLYFAGGRETLAQETFAAAEENRAASLHTLQALPGDWREKLPVGYWESLARLHATEVELLSTDSVELRNEMGVLRSAVLEMEAKAGTNTEMPSRGLSARVQASLPGDAVLLTFHLGERGSFMWAISRERCRLYRLPGKGELSGAITGFVQATSSGESTAALRGRALCARLFGQLEPVLRDKPRWILALDEQLFRVPFAALVTGWSGSQPVYLAERHSLRVTTGVLRLGQDGRQSWRNLVSGKFLGIGDAIYNTADPRWTGHRDEGPILLPWLASAAPRAPRGPVMARLAGTAAEVESCARAWNPQPGSATLLRGADASLNQFGAAMREKPSVIHIAAHFRESSLAPHYSMIGLSVSPAGDAQWLSPLEITRSKVPTGLVALSGCSSGRADALPGSGLMGLTRAWLAAGARAVIASHWATPDDSGALFIDFYKHFRETPEAGPAVALQRAQLDMLRAGGWRSNPQYWATYFVNGDL
jgi:tetratricopeptide (TPR) repeat protein